LEVFGAASNWARVARLGPSAFFDHLDPLTGPDSSDPVTARLAAQPYAAKLDQPADL
jgi:hypothetical protein